MASHFKSVAQRLRSWFLPRKLRRSQQRTRFLRIEQMEERALLANIGVSIDNAAHNLLIFDPATGTQTGLVSIPTTSYTLDTVIAPTGNFAYVSDFSASRVWVVDLAAKTLASGTNPISVTTFAEDLDITDDGHYLLVSDGGSGGSFAVVDTTAHMQVFSGNTPGGGAIAISTQGTDVLISSASNPTYRYSINPASGALRYTGQLNAVGGMNVTISPNGTTALVHNAFGGAVTSILVSGMTTLDSTPIFIGTTIEATAFSPDGKHFYVRTRSTVVGFNYDPATGEIGDTVLFTSASINPAEPYYGVDQLDATSTRVYTQDGDHVLALDALTGAAILGITPVPPVAGASFVGVDIASNLSIVSLSPHSAVINGASFTLTVNGQDFYSDSSVQWNGVPLTTTFVGSTKLTAVVPAGDLAQPRGSTNITVVNPTTDAGTSRAKVFYLNAPGATAPMMTAPTSTAITFNSATLGGTVANDNGSIIQIRGILYAPTATNPNPTVGGAGVIEVGDPAASTGAFTASLAGLNPNTSYSFVAFATNDIGTAYTTSVSTFSTLSTPAPLDAGWTFTSAGRDFFSGATLGSRFSTSGPITISHLGFWDGRTPGLAGSHPVGIWSDTGTLLAQTTVLKTDPLQNGFRYHGLTTPLVLSVGTYVVGGFYGVRDEYGFNAKNFTTLPGVTFLGAAADYSGAFAFPEEYEDDPSFLGFFGANFLVASSQVSTTTTVTAANATYDGNPHGATAVVTPGSPAGGTTFLYTGTGATVYSSIDAPTNAGTYHVVASFTPSVPSAYTPSSGSADYTISKKAIIYTIGDATHVYGSTVNLAATLGTTINTGVNDENLGITYASTGNTVTANVGSYAITGVVSDGTGLASNYTVTLTRGILSVTRATLTGDATTQDALNMAKQGMLTITVSNIAGLLNGDTLTTFLSTAQYYITVRTNKYVFVPTTVTTAGGRITIAYTLKNSALASQLAAELADNTSAATAISAGFYMESMNYTFTDDHLTRLFSTLI